jgi:hypothetical protein
MVTINIGRKEAIFFGTILLVFVVAGLAVAYNSGQPAVHGHDANEIANLPAGGGAAGGAVFGSWSVIGTNIAGGTNYGPAATDGIVTATAWDGHLQGFTDSTATPTRMVIRHNLYHSGSGSGITMPVKKGDYWRVETQGGDGLIDGLYWLPVNPASSSGGMYLERSGCRIPNPITGSCSCPSGYTPHLIFPDDSEGHLTQCLLSS